MLLITAIRVGFVVLYRLYFLISVFVLSTLNNTVMGTFRNNPIKENVVFLMGKIEIIM